MSHSLWGPSVFKRRRLCPASARLEAGLPDTSSEAAEEGTAGHMLAEDLLNNGGLAKDKLGAVYNGYTVDHDMAHAVQEYVDAVRNQIDLGGEAFIEARVNYDRWVPGGFGTTDAGVLFPETGHAVVNDLKMGRGVKVFAEGNDQGLLYALGFYQEYGDFLVDIERITVWIHQPRLNHSDRWDVSVEELLAFGETAREVYEIGSQPDAPAIPGEEQCRFCKAAATCKARAEWLTESVGAHFDFDTGALTTLDAEQMTPEEIGRIYGHLDDLSNWIKAVKDHVANQLEAGEPVPGWKLVLGGRRTRFWKDEAAAEAALKGMRLKADDMYTKKLISPAQAEKRVTDRQRKRLDELVGWTQGKPTVAPENDPREAVSNVAEDFDFI